MFQLTRVLVLLAALGLAACGGGGGSDGGSRDQGGDDTASAVETLLFYTEEDGSGNMSLHAVDPRNPGNPAVVESELAQLLAGGAGSRLGTVTAGTYDAGTVEGAHKAWVVFASADGHLYRVTTEPGEQVGDFPDPVRISSEDKADTICNLELVTDYADPLDSVLRYDLPDGTGSCFDSDDTTYIARLNAGSGEAPVAFDQVLGIPTPGVVVYTDIDTRVRDTGTGALKELVYVDGNNLKHFDIDAEQWDIRHTINPGSGSTYNPVFADEHTGRVLLKSTSGGELHLYDPVAETSEAVGRGANVPDPLPTVDDAIGVADHMVLAAGFDPAQLFSLDLSVASPELVRLSDGGYSLKGIVSAGAQRVAWAYQSTSDPDQDDILESVQLDGSGSPVELASGDLVVDGVESPATSQNWVYYGAWGGSLEFTAVNIKGPGSGETPLGADSIGNTWSPELSVAGERAERIMLDDNGTLVSIDASAPAGGGRIEHGSVPTGLEGARRVTYASSFAPAALVRMERSFLTEEDDLVFIDTRTSGSVVRITDDANVDARPVEGF